MSNGKGSAGKGHVVERRSFYPAFLAPLPAETRDLKARQRKLSDVQRGNQKKCSEYVVARDANAEPQGLTRPAFAFGGVAGGLALAAVLGGAVTKTWLFGMHGDDGAVLIPGAASASLGLGIQGALGVAWFVASIDTAKRRVNALIIKQFQEWTRSVKVDDDSLMDALMPRYAEENPYDPSNDEFQYVIGEHYGTEGHKFSNEAWFYGIPFSGLVTGGTVCFGVSGTGKTASVLKNFMRQGLSWKADVDYDGSGMGMEKCAGLFLDPKGSFAAEVESALGWAGVDPVLETGKFDITKAHAVSPLLFARHARGRAGELGREFDSRFSTKCSRRSIALLEAAREVALKLFGTPKPSHKGGSESLVDRLSQNLAGKRRDLGIERKRVQLGAYKVTKDGRTLYRMPLDPKVKPFRGRKADYLELGYDEFRINRIISAHNGIQSACKAMTDSGMLDNGGGGKEVVKPNQGPHGKGSIEQPKQDRRTTRVKLPSQQPGVGDPWTPKGEVLPRVYLGKALKRLMTELERLLSATFLASEYRQACQESRLDIHGESKLRLLEGVPGTAVGEKDDMEAYADLRALIRQMAPTKDRPGEHVLDYRCRWIMREAGAAAYSNSISAILELIRTAIRDLEWLAGDYGQLRPMVSDLKAFVTIVSMDLQTALGDGAYESEEDRGRGKVKVHPELARELKRVESYLSPAALADVQSGSMLAFRMVQSSLPSPRPRSAEDAKILGLRFSAPDPITQVIESIQKLRAGEDELGDLTRTWLNGVVGVVSGTTEMLSGQVETCCREIEAILGGSSPKLRARMKAGFDFLVSDLVEDLPKHLGDAFAAWLVAHPSRGYADALMPVTGDVAAERYATADLASEEIPYDKIMENAISEVLRTDSLTHDTHLHGPGPLGGIMLLRYAGDIASQGICELLIRNPDSNSVAFVEEQLRTVLTMTLQHMGQQILTAWKDGYAAGGVTPGSSFDPLVRRMWTESQAVMKELQECYTIGADTNMQEDLERLAMQTRELAGSRSADVGNWAAPEWREPLLFSAKPYRSFWRGVQQARRIPVASLATFDSTWSTVVWKRLLVALQSVPMGTGENNLPGWEMMAEFVSKAGDYHQSAVDGFAYYVAPNAGFKSDGPFCFNPVFLPGLSITNVASTFTKAVFGAMNKGGKSDPFWENAGNALVTNLLNATNLLYGYATFPILSKLISDKEGLKQVINRLEQKRESRMLTSDQMLDVQNILGWYYGQWETPGADKGETKVNIIATLSVVTNAFLEPGYQIAFAPQRLADISFPGWGWIFKHGKVVAVNLPIEKHSGVTPVVLALLNKSFQKYAQMRDQARVESEKLLNPESNPPRGRRRINEVVAARNVVVKKIGERYDWQEALLDWDQNLSGGLPTDSREALLTRMLPGHAALGADSERVSETIRTILFNRAVVRDSAMAFCLGVLGEERSGVTKKDLDKLGVNLSLSAQSAYRAGSLVAKLMSLHNLPWPQAVWADGRPLEMGDIQKSGWPERGADSMAVKAFLDSADHAMELLEQQGHREILMVAALAGGPDGFRKLFRRLPVALILPRKVFFAPSVQERLSQEKASLAAELSDNRRSGQSGGNRGGGLSLIAKVRDLTREIRQIEDTLEMMPNTSRYVIWCVDECPFYLEGESDAQYASVSRSARMINMIATQGPSSIYSRMEEKVADALLINFPNRIVLRQADAEEAETCANLLGGKQRIEVVDRSVSQSFDEMHGHSGVGRGHSSGGSLSFSVKEEDRYLVEPALLLNLPAFQAVAVSWDGFTMKTPRRIWVKPDFLYMDKRLRSYDPEDPPKRSNTIPSAYPKGTDLFGLTAMRLLQLGVYGSRAKG